MTEPCHFVLPVCVQVLLVTSSAEYCEQYVAYACRMSRLLNTPGKLSVTTKHNAYL